MNANYSSLLNLSVMTILCIWDSNKRHLSTCMCMQDSNKQLIYETGSHSGDFCLCQQEKQVFSCFYELNFSISASDVHQLQSPQIACALLLLFVLFEGTT